MFPGLVLIVAPFIGIWSFSGWDLCGKVVATVLWGLFSVALLWNAAGDVKEDELGTE